MATCYHFERIHKSRLPLQIHEPFLSFFARVTPRVPDQIVVFAGLWRGLQWHVFADSQEDELLMSLVAEHGNKNWRFIATHLPGRLAKQCRERWFNQYVLNSPLCWPRITVTR